MEGQNPGPELEGALTHSVANGGASPHNRNDGYEFFSEHRRSNVSNEVASGQKLRMLSGNSPKDLVPHYAESDQQMYPTVQLMQSRESIDHEYQGQTILSEQLKKNLPHLKQVVVKRQTPPKSKVQKMLREKRQQKLNELYKAQERNRVGYQFNTQLMKQDYLAHQKKKRNHTTA